MKHSRLERHALLWLTLLFSALITWPVWRWLWGEWQKNEYYSHGFLIVPIALFIAWRQLRKPAGAEWSPDQGDSHGLVLLGVSLAVLVVMLFNRAYYLAAFAMIGLIGGLVWTFGGRQVARQLAFPILFLVLMVPVPFIEQMTLPLAHFTGAVSGALMKLIGLDIVITGSAVKLPDTDLVIGAQCSGINSMIALLTLTSLIAYVTLGPTWGRITLVLLAIPLAMLGNIIRVANLMLFADVWGVDTAFKLYHDYSGIVIFLLVLLLMKPLTRMLQCTAVRSDIF